MNLQPDETQLIGDLVITDGRVTGNHVCLRIDTLVSSALTKVGSADEGWSTLYVDPTDGRLWERSYPQSYMQGGGPPSLVLLSNHEASAKYHHVQEG